MQMTEDPKVIENQKIATAVVNLKQHRMQLLSGISKDV
jgi:hypothetical protein